MTVTCRNRRILYFFTLYFGRKNVLLSHTEYWVNEFAKHFDVVRVYAVHSDGSSRPSTNVHVYDLGGGSVPKRIVSATRLLISSIRILSQRGSPFVLYHMFPTPAIVLGPILKLRRTPQMLWYSHSSSTFILKLANKFVDYVATPTTNSFPIPSNKVHIVGHGIPGTTSNSEGVNQHKLRKADVLYVGRVSPIKKLEVLIEALSQTDSKLNIVVVGPVTDLAYQEKIRRLSAKLNIEITFFGPIPFNEVGDLMANYSFFYSGNPKTLDKASVQAAIAGCFVLSEEAPVLRAVGMMKLWNSIGFTSSPILADQIRVLSSLDKRHSFELREDLKVLAYEQNRLDQTVIRMVELITSRSDQKDHEL